MTKLYASAISKLRQAKRAWRLIVVSGMALALAGCAAVGAVSNIVENRTLHSLTFEPYKDSTGIELLYYRYGSADQFGLRTSPEQVATGKPVPGVGITGELPVGDDFYAKWRIVATGQVIEDTVNLKSRRPFSMNKQQIRPIIEGSQLYIYLISYDPVRPLLSGGEAERIRRTHQTLKEKAFSYSLRDKVIQIYPTRIDDPHLPADYKN